VKNCLCGKDCFLPYRFLAIIPGINFKIVHKSKTDKNVVIKTKGKIF